MQNKKPVSTTGLNKKMNQTITVSNYNPNKILFQYRCSFCQCELSDGGLRFNGVGACQPCDELALLWVKSLRQHRANYYLNLGVRK